MTDTSEMWYGKIANLVKQHQMYHSITTVPTVPTVPCIWNIIQIAVVQITV